MNLELISDLDTLLRSQEAWNALAGDRAMLGWDWQTVWLEQLGQPATPAVLVAKDDHGQWIGIAPFCLERGFVNKLRLLSSGTACGDYLSLLSTPEHSVAFGDAVADWLFENCRSDGPVGSIDLVELEGVAANDPVIERFVEMLTALQFSVERSALESCWVTPLDESMEDLESNLSKSMRRKFRNARKRLANPDSVVAPADASNFESHWATFVDLHQRRRISLGQPGCFADPRFECFLKEVVSRGVTDGSATLFVHEFEDSPLSSVLLFSSGENLQMYQSGIDPDRVNLEPGHQFVYFSIEHAIATGKTGFDFLRGDEPYKARWNASPVGLERIRLVPRNMSARIKQGSIGIGKSVRDCLRMLGNSGQNA